MRGFVFIFILLIYGNTQAQIHKGGWSVSALYGTTIAHTKKIQSIKSNNPIGLQFDLFRQKDNQENYDLCKCYPQSGLSLSVFDYGNHSIVGQGAHLNFYLEPQFKVSTRNYFIVRGSAGLAFMNRPFDSITNPNNLAYSLPISGFVSIGPGWRYYLSSKTSVFILFPFNHVSNGGIKDPNIGLNFPSVHFGITKQNYNVNRTFNKSYSNSTNYTGAHHLAWSMFYTSRTVKNGEKERFSIFGLEVAYLKQISSLLSLNSALEFYKDNALQERYRREQNINENRYRTGLMSGVQIHLGKFELTHRLGVYLYDPGLYNGRVFHRHGLQYKLNEKLSLGVEVKAHKEVANFLDFRMAYRLPI